ncbi:MAG: hypothetical protein R2791_16815 [Saprospiraceae bacterium]
MNEKVESFKPRIFQAAHKYVAIIKADGDNIGKMLKALPASQKDDRFQEFDRVRHRGRPKKYPILAVNLSISAATTPCFLPRS